MGTGRAMSLPPIWREVYLGGTPETEEATFRSMVGALLRVQTANAQRAGGDHMLRMMHAKTIVGMVNASLAIDQALPAELAVGHFQPGALLPVILRLSNASGVPQTDAAPDLRGLALRISLPRRGRHDLLLANFPTSVARDAGQFFEIAIAGLDERETFLARLADRLGLRECQRIAADLKASLRLCASLAGERFCSGSAYLWGESPVRFDLLPMAAQSDFGPGLPISADMLRCELAARLAATDVRYRLAVQAYVDEERTPIEDAAKDWAQQISPSVEIATLTIPKQDILGRKGQAALRQVDRLAFDPWNAPAGFRPLGSLNRLRRFAYSASAWQRLAGDRQF